MVGGPEVRVTPRGTVVMRLIVDCASRPGEKLAFSVVMAGDEARLLGGELRPHDEVTVTGSLRAVVRRTPSGLPENLFEVIAEAIEPKK